MSKWREISHISYIYEETLIITTKKKKLIHRKEGNERKIVLKKEFHVLLDIKKRIPCLFCSKAGNQFHDFTERLIQQAKD